MMIQLFFFFFFFFFFSKSAVVDSIRAHSYASLRFDVYRKCRVQRDASPKIPLSLRWMHSHSLYLCVCVLSDHKHTHTLDDDNTNTTNVVVVVAFFFVVEFYGESVWVAQNASLSLSLLFCVSSNVFSYRKRERKKMCDF